MLMNITVQTFKTENELELSVSRWDSVKDQFMPRFREAGPDTVFMHEDWESAGSVPIGFRF